MSVIIKNGTIVTASDMYKADVKIEGEVITSIEASITPEKGDQVIDAAGQYVFPGGVDIHTHLDHFGTPDNFESGTMAAVAGGITTVASFVEPEKDMGILDTFKDWKNRRAKPSYIDYALVPTVTGKFSESTLEEIPALKEEGVGGLKLFLAYGHILSDVEVYKIFKKAAEYGILCHIHGENGPVCDQMIAEAIAKGNTDPIYHGYSRITGLEAEATFRGIALAEAANAPVRVVHVSCKEAIDVIAQAQSKGAKVLAETCPHYLTRDISYLALPNFEGAKYVCAPPLREKEHQQHLWDAINANVITTVGSDHAPVCFEGEYSKQRGREAFNKIPNGCAGVEDIFSVVYHFGVHEKRISLQKFVEILCANPTKEMGLYPKKGCICIGSDADIVLLDPNKTRIITQAKQYGKTDFNSWEGTEVHGVITHVLSRGEEVVRNGEVIGKAGRGQYLNCNNSSIFK